MSVNIDISESQKEIERKIKGAIVEKINNMFKRAAPKLEVEIANIIGYAIEGSPEYQSLVNGRLKYEFGLVDAAERMGTVLDVWKGSLRSVFTPMSPDGKGGGLLITAIKSNYDDVIRLPDAILVDKDYALPWLKWLLFDGSSTIIVDYHVQFGGYRSPKPSRTGGAIMVPRGNWHVPAQFAGTRRDNFVTRSLLSVDKNIRKTIIKELRANVN